MQKSDSIVKLTVALIKAKRSFAPLIRNQENPGFKRDGKVSKYADLAAVIESTEGPLLENGLVLTQFPHNDGERVGVQNMLLHESGEFLEHTFTVPIVKQDAQTSTAAITYVRRTSMKAILGISDEDDDGNTASGTGNAQTQVKGSPAPATKSAQAPKAENPKDLPGTQPSPKEPVSEAKSPDVPVAGSSELPTEEQLVEFRKQFKQLGDDLAAAGLKSGRGLPINRKVRAYLLAATGRNDTPEITLAQWQAFFSNAANVKNGENGAKSLVELIDKSTCLAKKLIPFIS